MREPKWNIIEIMMKTGDEFSLDEKEYEKKTGSTLPKNKYYLEKICIGKIGQVKWIYS